MLLMKKYFYLHQDFRNQKYFFTSINKHHNLEKVSNLILIPYFV